MLSDDGSLVRAFFDRIWGAGDEAAGELFDPASSSVGGNLAVGISGNELMVRVGKDAHDEAVSRPGARIFDLSSRPIRGWVVVSPVGISTEADLDAWIQQGVDYAESLRAK